jgi:hypothetical protein
MGVFLAFTRPLANAAVIRSGTVIAATIGENTSFPGFEMDNLTNQNGLLPGYADGVSPITEALPSRNPAKLHLALCPCPRFQVFL